MTTNLQFFVEDHGGFYIGGYDLVGKNGAEFLS